MLFSFVAQCCMVGCTLHYCFEDPDMTKALLSVLGVALFGICYRLDHLIAK